MCIVTVDLQKKKVILFLRVFSDRSGSAALVPVPSRYRPLRTDDDPDTFSVFHFFLRRSLPAAIISASVSHLIARAFRPSAIDATSRLVRSPHSSYSVKKHLSYETIDMIILSNVIRTC